MDLAPDVIQMGLRLAEAGARHTATQISDRVRTAKAAARDQDTIASLEQIVSDLIDDKQEITRIAQSFQQELVSQRITAGDVRYISDTVVPLIKDLMGTNGALTVAQIEMLERLLSVETVNVMQLLGFDFRRALGEPLTQLAAGAITARIPSPQQRDDTVRIQIAAMELAKDAAAYARFREMFPLG